VSDEPSWRHQPRTRNEVALRQQPVSLTNEQLKFIASTEFVPPGLRGNLPAIMACVATGRELGIGDMAALKSIHVIDGKPTFSAELMVQLVRRHGHSITGEVSAESATVHGIRADNGDTMSVTWTLGMAANAGLAGKQNWKKYPEAMLWARAVSQLCRMLFADCFSGATYTPEELEDSVGEPQAERVVAQPPVSRAADAAQELEPGAASEPASPTEEQDGEFVEIDDRRMMFKIGRLNGFDEDGIRAIVFKWTGQDSTGAIPKGMFANILADLKVEDELIT
jgi:hypothetical protein